MIGHSSLRNILGNEKIEQMRQAQKYNLFDNTPPITLKFPNGIKLKIKSDDMKRFVDLTLRTVDAQEAGNQEEFDRCILDLMLELV